MSRHLTVAELRWLGPAACAEWPDGLEIPVDPEAQRALAERFVALDLDVEWKPLCLLSTEQRRVHTAICDEAVQVYAATLYTAARNAGLDYDVACTEAERVLHAARALALVQALAKRADTRGPPPREWIKMRLDRRW